MSAKSFPFLNGDLGVSLGIPLGVLGGSSGALGDSWGGLGDTLGGLGGSSGALRESLGGQEASDLIAWGVPGGFVGGPGSVRGPWKVLRRSSGGLQGVLEESQGRKRLKKRRKQSTTEHNNLEIYLQLVFLLRFPFHR